MVYIVARKDMVKDPKTGKKSPEGIAIEQFTLDQNNFIDALSVGSRGSLKNLADLFILPGKNAEESIATIKNTKSWEDKYNLLQTTQGYSERIRKKRAAAAQEREETDAVGDSEEETLDSEVALAEAIREEWEILTESRGGTQWKISVAQLASFPQLVYWKTLGALPVSEKKIVAVATQYMDQLNKELMDLFQATQALSENINKYFTFDKRARAISSGEKAINDAIVIQNNLTAQIQTGPEEEKPE
jgi:predicted nucleic acid-binding protein